MEKNWSLFLGHVNQQYRKSPTAPAREKKNILNTLSICFQVIRTFFDRLFCTRPKPQQLVDFIRDIRTFYGGRIRIYAVFDTQTESDIFSNLMDDTFTCSRLGMARPQLQLYSHIFQATQTAPEQAIVVESSEENVLAARSQRAHSLLFTDRSELYRQILNITEDPINRGQEFLINNSGELHSITSQNLLIKDNFSQLLIYEATSRWDLVTLQHHEYTWNYFRGHQSLLQENYPDDADTTSFALRLLPNKCGVAHTVMDKILDLVTPDGIITTYFTESRVRTDPVVCVNVLRLFYHYGRGMDAKLSPTKLWLYQVLKYRAHEGGTRYYQSPDSFLFFISRLLSENVDQEFSQAVGDTLRACLQERVNAPGDALEIAMRIVACRSMNVECDLRLQTRRLLSLQQADGGWQIGWLCRTGKQGISIGNRGLTTALALKALEF